MIVLVVRIIVFDALANFRTRYFPFNYISLLITILNGSLRRGSSKNWKGLGFYLYGKNLFLATNFHLKKLLMS